MDSLYKHCYNKGYDFFIHFVLKNRYILIFWLWILPCQFEKDHFAYRSEIGIEFPTQGKKKQTFDLK